MKQKATGIAGTLVSLPIGARKRPLDGFWCHGRKTKKRLLVFVHGMHSNFYRSELKKTLMLKSADSEFDVLSFNNRGAEGGTNSETFRDCLKDIDAALEFGRSRGYRRFLLVGHSTGCQKIAYYQALRKTPDVEGLVLLAIGDDYAIFRKDLGRRFDEWVKRARRMVRRGKGDDLLGAPKIAPFSAKRFLSVADPDEVEQRIFDFDGKLQHFRKVKCPVLTVLAGSDEFETIRPQKAIAILDAAYRGERFEGWVTRGADHGFHGDEDKVAGLIFGRFLS